MEGGLMYFLDTNAIIWLYQGEVEKFSDKTRSILELNDLFISPLVKLELQYLFEVKRLKKSAETIVNALYTEMGLQLHSVPLNLLIDMSIVETWTRDPFDRLITSHAKLENAFLITKDDTILANYEKAIW